ncbi:hypothetical protein [Maribacter sp. 2307ULW6-5]|uniref:hypothetical protein n=1 Tax=Maribacter sp. 2307ULW6-5 TaxID=3386275 RepID=UPI0039BCC7A7
MRSALMYICLFTVCLGAGQGLDNAAKHFGAGVAIGAVGGYAAHKIFNGNKKLTWAGAVGSSLAAGLAKETYDVSNGNLWQTDDVLFAALGGFLSGLALDLLTGNASDRRGRGRRGNCGCLVVKNMPKLKALPNLVARPNLGSKSLEANIQAAYLYQKGL